MKHPNFFIIGAPRCGTSSLYYYLKQHPEVFMPEHKEPFTMAFKNGNFINDDPNSFPAQKTYRDILAIPDYNEYLQLFQKATNEKAIGEASTLYIHSLYACENIKQLYPDAKLIVSFRNPADQIQSVYYHGIQNFIIQNIEGIKAGKDIRALENLIKNQKEELFNHFEAPYYKYLKPYYDNFPRENIYIVLFENFVKDTKAVMKGIFKYLEIDDKFEPEIEVKNKGTIYRNKQLHYLINHSKYVRKATNIIQKNTPKIFSKKLLAIIWYIDKFNSKKPPPLSPDTRELLISIFREDIDNFQSLIERDLSHWS